MIDWDMFWCARGQLALRKLYHESERLLVVLYTSPTCGPCRTLKPIFSKVAEEFSGKVRSSTRLCLSCTTFLQGRFHAAPALLLPASAWLQACVLDMGAS